MKNGIILSKKYIRIIKRNNIKSRWRFLLFRLLSFIHNIKKLKKHEKICKDHDFCHVKMPNENNKILKYNPGEKSLKVPFIIYANLECLLEKQIHAQTILKNLIQKRKLSINPLVTRELHAAHLINRKLNGIIIEEKTVWKYFAKI